MTRRDRFDVGAVGDEAAAMVAWVPSAAFGPLLGAMAGEATIDVGRLFSEHAPFLYRVVERLTGRGDHVDDVVQEVFLTAHRRRADLRDGEDVRGWLYRVAVNLVKHHRRGLARRRALAEKAEREGTGPGGPLPDAEAARRQLAARVHACVEALPMKQREVFVLFELEGLEGAVIAALVGVPEGTVWTRLHHARARFRKIWTARHGAGEVA